MYVSPPSPQRKHRRCARRSLGRPARSCIHEDGTRAAIGLGVGTHALEPQELSFEIELDFVRPCPPDDVEPFLGVLIANIMIALLHSEHLELAFVPPDHDIEAEAALPDMVCGDELLGGDQGMKQRCMHGAKYGDVLGRAEEA